MEKFTKFARVAEVEFSDIVVSTQDLGHKLRIYLIDTSFIDFFYTTRLKIQRFSIHWERQHLDSSVYRIDDTPDKKWKNVATFPLHFHDQTYDRVVTSPFAYKDLSLTSLLREFLRFARMKI